MKCGGTRGEGLAAGLSRRGVLAAAAGLGLVGCGGGPPGGDDAGPRPSGGQDPLDWALSGAWRAADRSRDAELQPSATLQRFQLRPGDTVVEIWPGAGWWTRILAPFATATAGVYVPAQFELGAGADPDQAALVRGFRQALRADPGLYGEVRGAEFGRGSGPLAAPGTADLVAVFDRIHLLLAAGLAEKAIRDAYAVLKPAGRLGVTQARAAPGAVPDPAAADGRLPQPLVVRLAEEAGFVLEDAAPPAPGPDRMTLRFRKPAA